MSISVNVVPEPASIAMTMLGGFAVAGFLWRRRKAGGSPGLARPMSPRAVGPRPGPRWLAPEWASSVVLEPERWPELRTDRPRTPEAGRPSNGSGKNRRKGCSKGPGTKEYIGDRAPHRARPGPAPRARSRRTGSSRLRHEPSNLTRTRDEPNGPTPPATDRTQSRALAKSRPVPGTRNKPNGLAKPTTDRTQPRAWARHLGRPEIAERTQSRPDARPSTASQCPEHTRVSVEIRPDHQ